MFYIQFIANSLLFIIGLLGMFLNRKNILLNLICVEILLLAVNLNFILFSLHLDDIYGQLFSFFVLTVAAAESSIGLAIVILYYRIYGKISVGQVSILKG